MGLFDKLGDSATLAQEQPEAAGAGDSTDEGAGDTPPDPGSGG